MIGYLIAGIIVGSILGIITMGLCASARVKEACDSYKVAKANMYKDLAGVYLVTDGNEELIGIADEEIAHLYCQLHNGDIEFGKAFIVGDLPTEITWDSIGLVPAGVSKESEVTE